GLRLHVGDGFTECRVGSLKFRTAGFVCKSPTLKSVKRADVSEPSQRPGLQFVPTLADFNEIPSDMSPAKDQDHVAELHLSHGLVSRVAIDHQDHTSIGGEVTFGHVVTTRGIEPKHHGILGEK